MPPTILSPAPTGASAAATPRRAGDIAGTCGAAGVLRACASAAPHPGPAGRTAPGRARATSAPAGASLPAGSGRAGQAGAAPAHRRPTGPQSHGTTGEGS
ncbi:hypothetical protein ACGFYU_28755 [Streptomyces sp. NPDC048337]|uniref:hypothetical protein n=1 Tax=Streptomyces sp. NPDC048337 TaxID=3365535 RepID=UPI0037178BA0